MARDQYTCALHKQKGCRTRRWLAGCHLCRVTVCLVLGCQIVLGNLFLYLRETKFGAQQISERELGSIPMHEVPR